MAVKLRLKRMGKKKQPVYKLVAADARSPRDGKFIESIGLYNPKTEPVTLDITEERALYWLSVGAQPTDTVKNLLSAKGILLKRELLKKGVAEGDISAKLEEWGKKKESKLAAKKNKKAQKKSKKAIKAAKEVAAKPKVEEKAAAEKVEEKVAEVKGTASEGTEGQAPAEEKA